VSPANNRPSLPGLVASVAIILLPVLACCQANPEPSADMQVTTSCSWTADGEGTHNRFGYAVGAAGDVDGDGYDDVIIGGDQYKEFTGRVYVYAGGSTGLSASPIFVATGEDVNNHFGYTVGAAGDVNGDGYDDVIAGAYHYANFRGRAYVYTGGSDGLAEPPSFVLTGDGPDDYFGRSVATAGDVDGDGYDDVIVGAQAYEESTGRAYVYAGGPAGLSASPIFVVTGEGPSSSFGQSVGTAGDVDGDGYDDVIVGAHGHDHGTGRIYVYAGDGSGLKARPIFVGTGKGRGDRYGFAVGAAGDVNGDGYSDVIVGAYGVGEGTGQVYVYAGGPEGLGARPAFTATGEVAGDSFGRSVGTAGDVNGDGYDDVIIGARNHDGNTGRVYLYAGGAGGLDAAPSLIFDGKEPNSWYGHAVGMAGDVDGDGHMEVLVGAYGYGEWTGRAYVPCTLGDADGAAATEDDYAYIDDREYGLVILLFFPYGTYLPSALRNDQQP
jgi:hypothetical protein